MSNVGGAVLGVDMTEIRTSLATARAALDAMLSAAAEIPNLTDDELIASVRTNADVGRASGILQARLSAEVARRSRPELGHGGLAARHGHANATAMLTAESRGSFREAATQLRVGAVLSGADADSALGSPGPLAALAQAVTDGRLGVEGADQVIRTLTPVLDDVDPGLLRDAAAILAAESATRTADDLATMARGVRDTLDRLSVADRERHLRAQRGLRRGRVTDGLRRVTLVLDPETDAIIMGAIDHAMSPRLGGPRFTSPDDTDRVASLIDDDRTNEQLALDTLADLVRIGVDRDDGRILGASKPAVRVIIPLDDLCRGFEEAGGGAAGESTAGGSAAGEAAAGETAAGETAAGGVASGGAAAGEAGIGWIEGSSEPCSAATARRYLCEQGALPVVLDGFGVPLDVGRAKRLFTAAQRVALAIRDGGCRVPGCDRPPSWCEAHHIEPFSASRGPGGPTNLANGILLCRRHHLILHDQGWGIRRGRGPGEFWLIPPHRVDSARTPRPMPTKAPPWLRRTAG